MIAVRVHPEFVLSYMGFYLEGLGRVFGFDAIAYARDGGPARREFDYGFAFTLTGDSSRTPRHRRIFISAHDMPRIDSEGLAWCDRFGVVNHDPETVRGTREPWKIAPIGPSFGTRGWGSVARTLRDAGRIWSLTTPDPRRQLTELRYLWKVVTERLPERSYVPGTSRDGYVFAIAWPWKKHPEVNPPRARFMRACKGARGVTFEGGFAPRPRDDVPGISDVLASRKYPFREYVRKTQESAVVFNSPAVHGCLGWKLGEFLALGKAIVSLPLSRSMPAPLIHGEHVHFVEDDPEAMTSAIERIAGDLAYRTHLERGARRYYVQHLSPERVIERLVWGDAHEAAAAAMSAGSASTRPTPFSSR